MLVDTYIIMKVFINTRRMITIQGAHAILVRILCFLLFFSWRRALKRRSNHLKIVWILLEARHFNSSKNSDDFNYKLNKIEP